MNVSESCKEPILFIVGVPKAGTTSLFSHLASHPQIRGSIPKEPHYFLPAGHYLNPPLQYGNDPLVKYLKIFQQSSSSMPSIKLEGTTEYFRFPEIAKNINSTFPNSKILISLREPISRLISWYQMGMYYGWAPSSLSFGDFAEEMLNWNEQKHPGTRLLLEEGNYSRYLPEWLQTFGTDRIKVIWFDDFKNDARTVVSEILGFIGLDSTSVDLMSFEKKNEARHSRSPKSTAFLRNLAIEADKRIPVNSIRMWVLQRIRRIISSVLRPVLSAPAPPVCIRQSSLQRLYEFYKEDINGYEALGIAEPPWASFYSTSDVSELLNHLKVKVTQD